MQAEVGNGKEEKRTTEGMGREEETREGKSSFCLRGAQSASLSSGYHV